MTYRQAALIVVLGAILWSLMGLSIRKIEVAGTWAVLFWRSIGALPTLFLFILLQSRGRPVRAIRATGWAGVVGGLSLVMSFSGAIYAIQSTTVANAVFLFSAAPFFAALMGRFLLGEPVPARTWAAIALAGIGMWIMVREGLAAGHLAGNVAALVSALGFASFTIALRWGGLSETMPVSFLGCAFSVAVAGAILGATGQGFVPPLHDILVAVTMGAGILAVGIGLFTLGSRHLPAAEAMLLSLVEVMLAPVWVWLFLGETASAATFLGGAVVLAAIVLNAGLGARAASRD